MSSALLPSGGTSAWRKIRAEFERHLATVGPLPCRFCGQLVHAGDRWDLDHVTPRALGGTDDHLSVAHASCNRGEGARIAKHLRRHPRDFAPSRDW